MSGLLWLWLPRFVVNKSYGNFNRVVVIRLVVAKGNCNYGWWLFRLVVAKGNCYGGWW